MQLKFATSLGLYGESNSGKTHQTVLLLQYLKKRWNWQPGQGPVVRLVSWDSTLDPFLPFIQEGFVDAIPALLIRDGDGNVVIAQTLQALGRGHWWIPLAVPGAGSSGPAAVPAAQASPTPSPTPAALALASKPPSPQQLPPPEVRIWWGPEGEIKNPVLLKRFPSLAGVKLPSALPAACGIRAYVIEGLSEMADELLKEHGNKTRGVNDPGKQAGLKLGQEFLTPSEALFGLDPSLDSGSPTQSHYQMVSQDVLMKFLKEGLMGLPIDLLVVTMHQAKGQSELSSSVTVLGPDMPGQKAIGKVVQKFAHCLHLQADPVKDKDGRVKLSFTAAFRPHYATGPAFSGILWPAKLSLGPSRVEAFERKYPLGVIPLDPNPQGPGNSVADVLEFVWGSAAKG